MAQHLVIVESPAKAKTISRFLGPDYVVQASFGHVRDLPDSASDIPAAYKKFKWAKLGVNVQDNFEPLYVVTTDKKRAVEALKKAAQGKESLLLATDEDREGESISWHVLQVLNPSKKVKIQRIVFHEITPEAIQAALSNPRSMNTDLVRAQETRRILDRLYGYSLSPLLWKKVAPKLSAGRVQSVAVRLVVEKERQRIAFVSADYSDLEAELAAPAGAFRAALVKIDDRKVATGSSFEPTTGKLKSKEERVLSNEEATALAKSAEKAKPWSVIGVESVPGKESPPPPFMTSTLQQEGTRKLGMNSERVMRVAQELYEGIDIGGERIGLITYMRTDSLTLSERALGQAREVIRDLYGHDYLPEKAIRYKTKAKNAQEAHEAIRPTDLSRRPTDLQSYLSKEQLRLYELIWKRTIACQMKAAEVRRTTALIGVTSEEARLAFEAKGKEILFWGYLRAYVEGSDDPEAELESKETLLPKLEKGMELGIKSVKARHHQTKPPFRYTEASLIKKLEEEGIGRPSTYASIIGTIQARGYVFKKSNELVPTWTAFAVTELLESHFSELVDYAFTARMEDELDEIAGGKRDYLQHLRSFYHGEKPLDGLSGQIEKKESEIAYPSIPLGEDTTTGQPLTVRIGRFGAFLQRGEGGAGNTATLPANFPPDELTPETALSLFSKREVESEAIANDPQTSKPIFLRKGRYGSYLELGLDEAERKVGQAPKRIGLPDGLDPAGLEEADLAKLLSYPRVLGTHPESGQELILAIGRYGPYIRHGEQIVNAGDWREATAMSLAQALEHLSQPKSKETKDKQAGPGVIQEFGHLDGASGPVRLLNGRYGPYVTDGTINASLPRELKPEQVDAKKALELLLERAANPPKKKPYRQAGFKSKRARAN